MWWRKKNPKKEGSYIVTKELYGKRYVTLSSWRNGQWMLGGEVEEGIVAWKSEPRVCRR